MTLLDLLRGEAPLLLHEVHEAEIARAQHHRVRVADVVVTARLGAARGLLQRLADGRIVLIASAHPGDGPACERALDQLIEPVPVALLERRALGLAMIGEHHELVRPRGEPKRALDSPELLVELAERLERVDTLET